MTRGSGRWAQERDNVMQPWPRPTSLLVPRLLALFPTLFFHSLRSLLSPRIFPRSVRAVIRGNEQFGTISCSIHVHFRDTFTVGLSLIIISVRPLKHTYLPWSSKTCLNRYIFASTMDEIIICNVKGEICREFSPNSAALHRFLNSFGHYFVFQPAVIFPPLGGNYCHILTPHCNHPNTSPSFHTAAQWKLHSLATGHSNSIGKLREC